MAWGGVLAGVVCCASVRRSLRGVPAQLFVRTLGGRTECVDVHDNMTVADVKAELVARDGVRRVLAGWCRCADGNC